MKDFKFNWLRLNTRTWYRRAIKAASPVEAIEQFHRALAKRPDFPANIAVDHPFQEIGDGVEAVNHSMRSFANPFPVYFANEVVPIGHYKAETVE